MHFPLSLFLTTQYFLASSHCQTLLQWINTWHSKIFHQPSLHPHILVSTETWPSEHIIFTRRCCFKGLLVSLAMCSLIRLTLIPHKWCFQTITPSSQCPVTSYSLMKTTMSFVQEAFPAHPPPTHKQFNVTLYPMLHTYMVALYLIGITSSMVNRKGTHFYWVLTTTALEYFI